MKNAIITFLFLMCMCSCNSSTKSDIENFHSGIYKYVAYDSSDVKIINGMITLSYDSENRLKGTWDLDHVNLSISNHPHAGNGILEGYISNDTLMIDLHPEWADHNIILQGCINNDNITGKWSYISFIGWTDGGNFEAEFFHEYD